jgi:hypothetical protein
MEYNHDESLSAQLFERKLPESEVEKAFDDMNVKYVDSPCFLAGNGVYTLKSRACNDLNEAKEFFSDKYIIMMKYHVQELKSTANENVKIVVRFAEVSKEDFDLWPLYNDQGIMKTWVMS